MSNLPQELIEKIIDHVAEDFVIWPGESLLQCALVNRAFLPRSQFYIFSSIHIGGEKMKRRKRIKGLLKTVRKSPQMARCIESLQLDCTGYDNAWMFEDQNFTSLMEHISSRNPLRKLSIMADTDFVKDDFHELKYGGPLMDTFFLPFISPFITSLSLQRLLRVPIEVVTACVNLKDLELLRVVFEQRPYRGLHPPFIQPLTLRHLAVRFPRKALPDLLDLEWGNDNPKPSLNLSLLKSFTIYTDGLYALSYEQNVIDMSAESLEDLHIITLLARYHSRGHVSVDLHRSKSLRSLHVHVLFPEARLKYVLRTLSTITTKSFQTMSIDVKVATRAHCDPEVVLHADWSKLCAELNRIMAHSNFTLSIKLSYTYRRRRDGVDLDDDIGVFKERCRLIIARLREELRPLGQPPGTNLLLSYELDCI